MVQLYTIFFTPYYGLPHIDGILYYLGLYIMVYYLGLYHQYTNISHKNSYTINIPTYTIILVYHIYIYYGTSIMVKSIVCLFAGGSIATTMGIFHQPSG